MAFPRPLKLILLSVLTIVAVGLAGGTQGMRSSPRAHAAVWQYRDAHSGAPVPVIVQAAPSADPAALVRAVGGQVNSPLGVIHGVAAMVPGDRLETLAFMPGVTWVSLDGAVSSAGSGSTSSSTPSNVYPQEVHADRVWSQYGDYGQGVAVAVVDSGISDSADFGGRIVARVSRDGSVGDGYGHGTHVAGLIAGNGTASNGQFIGVAPQASLVDVKVGDNTGAASVSDVINGLQWVLDNKDAYNIRVVNLSLRADAPQSYTTDPLDAAVELLAFRGILVVVAAGNTGTAADAVSYAPANDPFVLTVGALDDMGTPDFNDDVVPAWSSRGVTQDGFAKPDIYVAGRHLISVENPASVIAAALPDHLVGSSYLQLSGTSMAAAVASGSAALVFQAHPAWTPGQVRAGFLKSSHKLPSLASARVATADQTIALNGSQTDATATIKPNTLLLNAAGVTDPNITWDKISWSKISWSKISWGSISWSKISWGYVAD